MLPKDRMISFLLRVPFRWMVRERKNRLKIESMAVAAISMKLKERIKHSPIASKRSPVTKRLLLNFIYLIPFCSIVCTTQRLLLEVNFIEKSYVLKLAASPSY
jgi:hypothetical protein